MIANSTTALRVLLVEDSEDDAFLIMRELKRAGFAPESSRVETAEAMAEALADDHWQIVVSDYRLPHFNGLKALALLREKSDEIPFFLVSGKIGEEQAVDALLLGANDCVMKDNLPRLGPTIRRELQRVEDRLDRLQAIEIERQQRQRADAFRDTAAALNQTLDLCEIAACVLKNIANVIEYEGACFVLVRKGVVRNFFCGQDHKSSKQQLQVAPTAIASICGLLPSEEPVIIDDARSAPGWGDLVATSEARSFVSAPLFEHGALLGHIILSSRIPGAFTLHHSSLLTGFASQAAMAVRNAFQFEAITQHRSQLRELSEKIVHAQEEERGRISRELHDEMGQSLTAILINTEYLDTILRPNPNIEVGARVSDRISEIRNMAKQTLEQVRGLSLRLRPAMLDDHGLLPTIRWFADRYEARTGIKVTFEALDLDDLRFGTVVETTLYRAVQEALTNVARHAKAKTVIVRLRRSDTEVILVVDDDGEGISGFENSESDLPSTGIGLLGMRERVSALQGVLTITSRKGEGTRLEIKIPYKNVEKSDIPTA